MTSFIKSTKYLRRRTGQSAAANWFFESVAGLVLEKFGKLPEVAERFDLHWSIEVVDRDGRGIDKHLVTRVG
jgi:CBS domain containing-hemolysin-like protein